jgi:4'-phosphopantetheinyl transferase
LNPDLISEIPNEGFIHIWIVQLDKWNSHLTELNVLLSDEELERSKRLKVIEKQEQFIISRGILRLILASYLDLDPTAINIQLTPDGKPFLERSDLTFNLSHSGNTLLLGVNKNLSLGIDIQRIYAISNLETIIENYFSENEKNYLKSRPADLLRDHFFSIWTAKEAYLKAIGKGFQESPTEISTLPDESTSNFLLNSNNKGVISQDWTITSINLDQNYKAAIAVNGEIKGIKRIRLTPGDYYSI